MAECIFCKILKGEIPAEFIAREADFAVIKDIQPKAPRHFLIIPLKHIASVLEMRQSDQTLLGKMIYQARQLAEKYGLKEKGCRLVINSGRDAGQEVGHLHIHFLGGKKLSH